MSGKVALATPDRRLRRNVIFRKQKRISKTFFVYYTYHGYDEVSCRFDVIAINGKKEVQHIQNAFDFFW